MKVDHVRLLVIKFSDCFRFYRDIIDMDVLWGNEADSYASFKEKGSQVPSLALFDRQAMAEALGTKNLPLSSVGRDKFILIIGVKDLDAEVKRMKDLGVSFLVDPRDYPDWGMRSAYLRDPDGNLLELTGELRPECWSQELRDAAKQYE